MRVAMCIVLECVSGVTAGKESEKSAMDSRERREGKRIVRSLSIEAVCGELAMYNCSNVGSNAVLRDRLLRASLKCLEPANQEIPWYPWDAEECDKSERVVHSRRGRTPAPTSAVNQTRAPHRLPRSHPRLSLRGHAGHSS